MSPDGGEVLLKVLRAHGIERIFCSPGTEWVPVWESLAKLYSQGGKTPAYINCRHEGLALSVASGYAKATGRLPAVLLHASVGLLHGAMSIRAAYHQHIPMLICTGDSASFGEDEDDKGEGWRWACSLSDIGGPSVLVKPYVKLSSPVTCKENLWAQVYRACEIAQTAPKGPVLLSIPWEFLLKSLPEIRIPPPSPPPELPQPNYTTVEKAARQLLQAQNPIILTEHAGANPRVVPKLVELAELLGIPVFECLNPRFANFPKGHSLHAGYDASEALQQADVVLVVGGTSPWPKPSALPREGTKVILLDEDTSKPDLPYWGYRIDIKLTGDVLRGLTTLLDIIHRGLPAGSPNPQTRERLEHWRNNHKQMVSQWEKEALAGQASRPIDPRWFFYIANKALPRHSVVLLESTTHNALIMRYMQQVQPNSYFHFGGGGLGRSLGEAAGMKLAWKDKPMVLFIGDGSFNYNPVVAALGLCQEYHLPFLTVVLNNGGYDTMKAAQQRHYPKGWAASSQAYLGVDIAPSPDYAKVAEAFDAYAEKLEEPEQIEPALSRAWQQVMAGRSALLDVILEPLSSKRQQG